MRTNKDIKFSYYSGNILKPNSLGFVTLDKLIDSIKNPKPKFDQLFFEIEIAAMKGDKALKRSLKQQLYSFTPSALIRKGLTRRYANVESFTSVMQIDFDGVTDIDEAIELKEHIFNNNKQIICAFLSPSRLGVKCLMRIKQPKNKEHYKALHKEMVKHFEGYSYLDESTNNAMLPMFLSRDKQILWRDFSQCEEWDKEDWQEVEYVNVVEETPEVKTKIKDLDKHTKHTINALVKRFRDIVDNGHPQVRTAALVAGSRVAAGYINENEAVELLIELAQSNMYLSKGLAGYIKTIKWGIKQGMKRPMYFKD